MTRLDDSLREELSAYIDGVLEESRVRDVKRLIEADADVRAEYDALRRCVGMLHALPDEPAPPVLRERVLDRLSKGRVVRLPVWVRGAVPLAATLLLVVLIWPSDQKETDTRMARREEDRFLETPDVGAGSDLGERAETLDAAVEEKEMRAPSVPDAPRPDEAEKAEAKVLLDVERTVGVARESKKRRGRDSEPDARVADGKKQDVVRAFQKSGRFAGADEKRAYLSQLGASDPKKIKNHLQTLAATLASRNDREQKPSTFAFDDAREAAQVRRVLEGAYGNRAGFALGAPAGVRLEGEAKDDDAAGAETSFGVTRKASPQHNDKKPDPSVQINGVAWGAYELLLTVPRQDLPQVYLWMQTMAASPLPKQEASAKRSALEKMKRSRAEEAEEAGGGDGGGGLAGRRSTPAGDAARAKAGARAEQEKLRTILLRFYYPVLLPPDPAAAKEERK